MASTVSKYLVKVYTEKDSLVGEAVKETMDEAAEYLDQRLQERPDCWGKISVIEREGTKARGGQR